MVSVTLKETKGKRINDITFNYQDKADADYIITSLLSAYAGDGSFEAVATYYRDEVDFDDLTELLEDMNDEYRDD